ncbi:hypothetical protein V8F20_004412 [Naviculisporaceae sp. PSN 640]
MEDEEEWEYEYSTTETETYYLTLDLSIRDFLERRTDDIVHNTRAGYRVWYNPNFNANEPITNPPESAIFDDGDNGDKDDQYLDKIGLPQPQGDLDPQIDPALTRQDGSVTEVPAKPQEKKIETIQIMELHSKEPIVSYRNHVFRGSWAENIGTEMIFTRQLEKDKDPLPMLRDMGRNVHLLASSATRINFKEVDLIPKEKLEAANQTGSIDAYEREDDIPERYKTNGGVYVHIGGDKSGQRQPQAHFLEDLIALKRKRGEKDEVTIQPLETKHNKLMVDDVEEERRRRKLQVDYERSLRWRRQVPKVNTDATVGAEEHYVAKKRKKFVTEPTVKKKRGRGSRPRVRTLLVRRQTPPPQDQTRRGGATGGDLSIPTPARWDDLPGRGGTSTQGG